MPLSSILTGPLIARALGPADRGAMAAVVVPISLANLLFTAGLPESLTFFVSKRRMSSGRALRIAVGAGAGIGLAVALGMIALTPVLLVRYPAYHPVFMVLLFTLPLSIGFAAVRGIAAALRRFDLVLAERASTALVRTGAIVLLALVGLLSVVNAAAVTVVAGVVGSFFLLRALRRPQPAEGVEPNSRRVASFAFAAAVGTIGSVLVLRLDQALMVPLVAPRQLGFYAVAVSLAELPLALSAAMRDVVFTVSSAADDISYAAQACRRTLVIVGVTCLGGVLVAPLLLPLLFGSAFAPAVAVTQVLFAGTLLSAVTSVLGAGLLSAGRAMYRSAILLGGAVLTIPLVIWWASHGGALGAGLASVATYAVMAAGTVLVFTRTSGLPVTECIVPTREDLRALAAWPRRKRPEETPPLEVAAG